MALQKQSGGHPYNTSLHVNAGYDVQPQAMYNLYNGIIEPMTLASEYRCYHVTRSNFESLVFCETLVGAV